jgi:biotin operon repressor
MRVFRRVIVTSRAGSGVSSSELGEELGLSRTSIVHHLNRLLESGVVERRKSRYFLRSNNLHRTLMELERDIERMFESMQEVADALDRELELPERRLLREEEEG